MTVEWDESLSVHVDLIDDQHRELIKRINDISVAVESHQSPEVVLSTLKFMSEYTEFHFSTEEKYMEQFEYPGRELHIKQHEEFKTMVRTMIEDFEEEGPTPALGQSINTYLLNWLVEHIKGIDTKLGDFLKDKPVSG